MTRESVLIVLGLLVAVSPFSGIPLSWLMWILPIIGFVVIIIGITLRNDRKKRAQELLSTVTGQI